MATDPEKMPPPADDRMDETGNGPAATTKHVVDADLARDAQAAAESEKSMTLMQGLRAFPTAVGWSVVISIATTMDGYDTGFLNALLGVPAFNQAFGYLYEGKYVIPAAWQGAVANSGSIGIFIGVLINGWLTERLGHRKILLWCYVILTGLIFIPFFAPNLGVLVAGEILCGLCWGQFSITAATYASEVCPLPLRPYLTSYINITWIVGQLLAACVLRGSQTLTNEWAYRIPFAVQWVWPVPLFISVLYAPESPWWLVRQDRLEEAEASLRRLRSNTAESRAADTSKTIAMMVHTNQLEKSLETGTRYWDCFRGPDLRRTEIACMAWATQVFMGLPMKSYDVYFFLQVGLPTDQAFNLNIGNRLIAIAGVCTSWVMLTYLGRRQIYMMGVTANVCIMLIIGFCSLSTNPGVAWAQSVLLMFWPFITSATVGSVAFTIVTEVGATRLRAKTIALARNTFNGLNIAWGAGMPYIFNPAEADLKGKAAFIFAGTGAMCLVWIFFRLPELKGRTFEEMDILFNGKVRARDFKTTEVDAYQEDLDKPTFRR